MTEMKIKRLSPVSTSVPDSDMYFKLYFENIKTNPLDA